MEALLLILALPFIAAFIPAVCSQKSVVRKTVPLLCWLQLGVLIYKLAPLISDSSRTIVFSEYYIADNMGALFLLLTTVVCASALTHAESFFVNEENSNSSYDLKNERLFYSCASIFLLAMSLIFLSDNLGILWIGMEATTLSSAALVYFNRSRHALEATWKYLIICSVGIAFALLGTFLIFAASQYGAIPHGSLSISRLIANAAALQYGLLKLGYIFCLVGYGTKAGIFPLHSWLPDAHSEAPAPASAMLSGALLNCALFAIWRFSQIVGAAHHESLASSLPLTLGGVTALAAGFFLIHQHGIKRMWAYSSIENVGIMFMTIGLASPPLFFLQALNHSLAKVSLFLLSGNMIQLTGTKKLSELKGLLKRTPASGILMALSAFAVTGSPPFGAFISEWLILSRCIEHKHWFAFVALMVALALSFVAVCIHVCGILFGTPKQTDPGAVPVRTATMIPALLLACALLAGITSLPSYLIKP